MDELRKKTVAYFYDEEYGNFSLGGCNPMRPHRVRLTNNLVNAYGLTSGMRVHRPRALTQEELNTFHADEYLDVLAKVTPNNQEEYRKQMIRFNMGPVGEADCPVFDGMLQYCQIYSGGSRDGALNLIEHNSDIAVNWSGGMHHAKKAEASGFCYVNDIVLAILELLKVYHRVLYVDIDIHHGDGVEEAFYLTDRVMTVSFHNYGDFFPGTGSVDDIGYAKGRNYSVNVPLREGMDDESYAFVYQPVMTKVMAMFQPDAIVVCAGADSLSGDRLGCFNLSVQGHSACIEFLAKYNVPLLLLGGGGYTMRNVSRCWCYETARLQGVDLPDELPDAALLEYNYYMDTKRLRIEVSNMMNNNSQEDLARLRDKVLQQLSQLQPPSGAALSQGPAVGRLPDPPEIDPDVRGGGVIHNELRAVKDPHDSDGDEAQFKFPTNGPVREMVGTSIDVKQEAKPAAAPPQDGGAALELDDAPMDVDEQHVKSEAPAVKLEAMEPAQAPFRLGVPTQAAPGPSGAAAPAAGGFAPPAPVPMVQDPIHHAPTAIAGTFVAAPTRSDEPPSVYVPAAGAGDPQAPMSAAQGGATPPAGGGGPAGAAQAGEPRGDGWPRPANT